MENMTADPRTECDDNIYSAGHQFTVEQTGTGHVIQFCF